MEPTLAASHALAAAPPTSLRQPGRGWIEVSRVRGRSVPTRVRSESPLRLLTPGGCGGNAAWIYSSTFGGGLVGGDHIELDLRIQPAAQCLLATQASTKVYRSTSKSPTRQTLNVAVGKDSTCVILPDPLTCFAGAVFEQQLRVALAENGSLVLLDGLTSGRRARGERWAFDRYLSRIDVSTNGKPIFRDALLLDSADGPIDGEHRMGRCDCHALILLLGPACKDACEEVLTWAASQPIERGRTLVFSASPLSNGAVIRVAGATTESVDLWIRQRLRFLPEMLGGDPWRRKS
jgi:urease accessory protein